ncbi:restless-like transposase [Hirsutella rhossiliensis]|uniref:Restless-like transposase n=1 Tax=Hirsutella rhossiliensis TaxID=111463 RepID=A0A9P8N477_9HYPO|nr:restless-like transposase [Hirsutella rhossiliensis]KAH0966292.1 restless-like transposase [Hirsutella rhossiliensis]
METDVPTKPQRASDGGSSSKSFVNMDALQDEWSIFPWNHFPGYTISERAGRQTSWVWQHGFDIQPSDSPTKRKWNIENHLFKEHRLVDLSGKRGARSWERNQDKTPSKNIVEMLNLNASDPKEQGIANALIQRFDKDHFQRLLLEWVVDANVSFRQPEHCRLRHIFEYLNPSVAVTNAHISHDTVRKRIVDLYTRYKTCVIDNLKSTRPNSHCVRRLAFQESARFIRDYMFYIDKDGVPSKLVLGMPELKISHSGENIAAQILEILESYEILDKVGYITLDNAGNMDTATEEIAEALGFDPKKRRVRCFGHVLNLVVKALLFGHKADAFEAEINGSLFLTRSSMKSGERKAQSESSTT